MIVALLVLVGLSFSQLLLKQKTLSHPKFLGLLFQTVIIIIYIYILYGLTQPVAVDGPLG